MEKALVVFMENGMEASILKNSEESREKYTMGKGDLDKVNNDILFKESTLNIESDKEHASKEKQSKSTHVVQIERESSGKDLVNLN